MFKQQKSFLPDFYLQLKFCVIGFFVSVFEFSKKDIEECFLDVGKAFDAFKSVDITEKM